jgi:hypothetical protein
LLGHGVGAFHAPGGSARLCFSGFQKIFLSNSPAKNADQEKDFPNLPEMRRLALGSMAHSPLRDPSKFGKFNKRRHDHVSDQN